MLYSQYAKSTEQYVVQVVKLCFNFILCYTRVLARSLYSAFPSLCSLVEKAAQYTKYCVCDYVNS